MPWKATSFNEKLILLQSTLTTLRPILKNYLFSITRAHAYFCGTYNNFSSNLAYETFWSTLIFSVFLLVDNPQNKRLAVCSARFNNFNASLHFEASKVYFASLNHGNRQWWPLKLLWTFLTTFSVFCSLNY